MQSAQSVKALVKNLVESGWHDEFGPVPKGRTHPGAVAVGKGLIPTAWQGNDTGAFRCA